MEIRNNRFCSLIAGALATYLVAGYAIGGESVGGQQYDGSGAVTSGPCQSAVIFEAQDGRLFEIDRRRVNLPVGQQVQVVGLIYPHVSVCRKYPWLDVSTWKAVGVTVEKGRSGSSQSAEPGTVSIPLTQSALNSLGSVLMALHSTASVKNVTLLVREGDAVLDDLPLVLSAVASAFPEAFSKVSVEIVTYRQDKIQWVTPDGQRSFNNLQEFKNALSVRQ